jgi:molecular chaperone GrpE
MDTDDSARMEEVSAEPLQASNRQVSSPDQESKSEPELRVEDEEKEALRQALEAERKNSRELANQIKYLQADIVNMQRQVDRLVNEAREKARMEFILELISVKEDLERAISSLSGNNADPLREKILSGLGLVISRIEGVLRIQNVEQIKVQIGSDMDPHFHEAVAYTETDNTGDGKILSVIRNGYVAGGKVIRPALVEIARQKPKEPTPQIEPQSGSRVEPEQSQKNEFQG